MAAFVPTYEDVPSYLLPMMNDSDRNSAYEAAIRSTIDEFVREQKRAPRVLDVGAGAGLLSLMCLRHGAAHVSLLEANSTLSTLASQQLTRAGHPASKWTLLPQMSTQLTLAAGQQPFDMIVSELIGTMLHSESMAMYLWDLVKRDIVQSFPVAQAEASESTAAADAAAGADAAASLSPTGRVSCSSSSFSSSSSSKRYMVPLAGVMSARVYRCAHATGLVTALPYAPMTTVYEAVYDTRRISARADWNVDEAMRFCLASGPWEPLSASIPVLREQYNSSTDSIAYKQFIRFSLAPNVPADAVVVLEWRAQLSNSHSLLHTMDHVSSLHSQVRLARWINWGFTFAPLHHFVDDASLAAGSCEMQLAWQPADMELVSRRPGAAQQTPPTGAAAAAAATAGGIGESSEAQETNYDKWTIVPAKRLNKVIAATKLMVQRGKSSV